jgi:hypothetical protein
MDNQTLVQLELQIKKLIQQNLTLSNRINFLERENTRRRSDINQIASALNRKG